MRLRFKHFLRERVDLSDTGTETLLSVSEYYGVKPREKTIDSEEPLSRAESLEGYRRVKRNDLVMNYMLAWKGAYGVSDCDGIVSPAYAVFEIDQSKVDLRYVHHRLRSDPMRSAFRAASKGIIESRLRLYPDALLALSIELPDLSTQKAIAEFLDRETARIDQLIEKKQRLVELLGEKQRAVIDQLITGGLSENKDKKPVSVSWLKDIPSHWQALPIKKLLAMPITDGPHETPEFVDEGVIFVSAEAISGGVIDFNKKRGFITPEANAIYSRKYCPRSGDIYIVKSGATTGKSAMVRDFTDFNIWSPLAVLRPASKVNGEWLLLTVRSTSFLDALALNWSWGTQQNIGMGVLGRIVVPVAPPEEQRAIVQYYERETTSIREVVSRVAESIDRLRELRSSLITAAVTGQIDVATWGRRGATDRRLEAIEEALSEDTETDREREEAAV
jgi:type I restriction enzyme S subunit